MAHQTYKSQPGRDQPATGKTLMGGYVFGAPLGDLGFFAILLMSIASGFIAFFAASFVGIVFVGIWNGTGRHGDFAWSYLRFGLPAGILVLAVVASYLGMLWIRRITRKA